MLSAMQPISALLLERAHDSADRVFCSFHGRDTRFDELLVQVQQMAGALAAAGVAPGARVGLMLAPSVEHIALYLATGWLGATAVPFSIHLKVAGLELQLRSSRPAVIVAHRAHADALREALRSLDAPPRVIWFEDAPSSRNETSINALLRGSRAIAQAAPRTLDDTVAIAYTSGTTGAPKGVMMSERWYWIGAKNAGVLSQA